METTHNIIADRVAGARLSQLAFLRGIAALSWAEQMRNGVQFLTPAPWANLDIDERARRLADAEAQRLASASLYFLDDRCTEAALRWAQEALGRGYELSRRMLPADAGFLVWAVPVSSPQAFGEVIAVHWRVEADGVRLAWWTDGVKALAALADERGYSDDYVRSALDTHGPLMYERERFLPFAAAAALSVPPDRDQDAAVHGLTMVTIGTWRLLAEDRAEHGEVAPPESVEREARSAGLTENVVHAASLPPGTDPAAIWSVARH